MQKILNKRSAGASCCRGRNVAAQVRRTHHAAGPNAERSKLRACSLGAHECGALATGAVPPMLRTFLNLLARVSGFVTPR